MTPNNTSATVGARRTSGPVVLDEAFADLPEVGRRVDRPNGTTIERDYAAESRQMIAQIGQQLQSIERQRARLVSLLEELDIPSR